MEGTSCGTSCVFPRDILWMGHPVLLPSNPSWKTFPSSSLNRHPFCVPMTSLGWSGFPSRVLGRWLEFSLGLGNYGPQAKQAHGCHRHLPRLFFLHHLAGRYFQPRGKSYLHRQQQSECFKFLLNRNRDKKNPGIYHQH